MFLLNWFSQQREQEKKEQLCETLLKDIRFDIGDCFREDNKKRVFSISDLHIKGNTQYADLHIHLSEPLNQAHQSDWTKDMGKPIVPDDERMQLFYDKYYEEVVQSIKRHFSYAKDIRHFPSLVFKDSEQEEFHIDLFIHVELNERMIPLSRKIKKSILKSKEYFLKRT